MDRIQSWTILTGRMWELRESGIVRALIILDMKVFSGLLLWEDPVIPITDVRTLREEVWDSV